MLHKDPSYRRLKTGGYGPSGSASYWLGTDHLFVVAQNGYVERYHRFLFADIQAIVIRRNRLQLLWTVVFAAVALFALLGAGATLAGRPPTQLDTGALTGFLILAGIVLIFLVLLVSNLLLGPTCVCHLRTAVQTLPLPQVRRWRKADLLLRELTPLIAAAQGRVAPAAVAAAPQADIVEAAPPSSAPAQPEEPGPPPPTAL